MHFDLGKQFPRKPAETRDEPYFLLSTLANYEVEEISPRQVAAWIAKHRRPTEIPEAIGQEG